MVPSVRTIVKIALLTAATVFAMSVLPAQQNTSGTAASNGGSKQASSDVKFKQEFGPTQANKKQELVQNSGSSKHGAAGQANTASASSSKASVTPTSSASTSATSSTRPNHRQPTKTATGGPSSTSSK
jgi:hypothetical protein